MICPNCKEELGNGQRFCPKCGAPGKEPEKKRFCTQCGKELGNEERFCSSCGADCHAATQHRSAQQTPHPENQSLSGLMSGNAVVDYFLEYKKSLPAFIIGLIGSILGMFGGICTTMCSFGSASNSAFLYIFVGAVIGLIGSCMCLKKARIGSLLQLVGVIMIIVRAYSRGAEFFTVFSIVLLLTASVIGIVSAHLFDILKKK